jgi:hypothetical protein
VGAPKVATGGTIFPGLIELHNHLSYNAMPLWEVPTQYSNNGQWRGGEDYSRRITKPSQVLGQSPGVLQALVRYVECRALLGGATTTQGITLANASSLTKHFKGVVRNVESPGDQDLPAANTNIANPDVGGAGDLSDEAERPEGRLPPAPLGGHRFDRPWLVPSPEAREWLVRRHARALRHPLGRAHPRRLRRPEVR